MSTATAEAVLPRQAPAAEPLDLLHEVSRELVSILDGEELLRRVAELVKPLVDYQLFAVFLWNEKSEELESVVAVRRDGCRSHKANLRLGEGLAGAAAAARRPVRVASVRRDPRYVCCGDERVRSEMALPLLVKDRLIGVLDLESYRRNAFGPQQERLLTTLAANLAVALDNAALYERVRADERALARDLETAREVQRVLLPRRTPWLPGLQTAVAYSPAHHLAGDLYDFLSYGPDRTAVAVGDVAGKGTGAALYGSLAVGHLRGYAMENHCDPACILSYLNAELVGLDAGSRFLALAFAVYDARQRSLTLASSGVPFPYLVRRGGIEEIEVRGVPVGLMPTARYQNASVALESGDVVVFTTDGIDESLGPGDEPFGDGRVRQALAELTAGPEERVSAREIADGLLAATDRHLAGREPSDDRTVVVLRVTG